MTCTLETIKCVDGVSYAVEFGNDYRVVFKHNADSTAIHEVENITGCSGSIGATQEHHACIDYPIDEVDRHA